MPRHTTAALEACHAASMAVRVPPVDVGGARDTGGHGVVRSRPKSRGGRIVAIASRSRSTQGRSPVRHRAMQAPLSASAQAGHAAVPGLPALHPVSELPADLQPEDIAGPVQPEVRHEQGLFADRQCLSEIAVGLVEHPFEADGGIEHQRLVRCLPDLQRGVLNRSARDCSTSSALDVGPRPAVPRRKAAKRSAACCCTVGPLLPASAARRISRCSASGRRTAVAVPLTQTAPRTGSAHRSSRADWYWCGSCRRAARIARAGEGRERRGARRVRPLSIGTKQLKPGRHRYETAAWQFPVNDRTKGCLS